MRRRVVTLLLVSVASVFTARGVPASGSAPPARGCTADALALSETLEPVIEAVTDGRPDRVRRAAARAQAWWAAHRARWASASTLERAMTDLEVQVSARRAPLAARAAVMAATAALDGCPEPATLAAHLMRVDLAGMAGWLRARGVNAPFPRDADRAVEAIGGRLRARGHGALADRLASEVAAALGIPVRAGGDVHAADVLLARVDEAEQAVRDTR